MPNENFIIVSNKINKDILKYENFTLYDSDWKTNKLTDEELKSIFNECKLSIIPIKTSSLQPSGQSVALQSFAMEVPVMMSNFKGVWDKDLLLHMENIFFVEEASVDCWINNINLLLDQKELQEKLIHNARKLIDENLNLSNFYKRLDKVINS
jgi:glycosyltransferase involved in cell wall biosynthesis